MKNINGVNIELHADDYGQTLHTTEDILELMKTGCLDGISILPNMPVSERGGEMLKSAVRDGELPFVPLMSIHLDLVEGRCLSKTSPDGTHPLIPWTWKKLFFASYHLGGAGYGQTYGELYEEIKAQITAAQRLIDEVQELAAENNIPYTPQKVRIDAHQHAHMVPIVWKALMAVIRDEHLDVEYIRNSHEPLGIFLSKRGCGWRKINIVKNRILALYAPKVESYMSGAGYKNMYLWGLIMSGHMDMERIEKVMPDMLKLCGSKGRDLELNIHPGLMLKDEMCPEVPEESCRDFYLTGDRTVEADTVRRFHKYLEDTIWTKQ